MTYIYYTLGYNKERDAYAAELESIYNEYIEKEPKEKYRWLFLIFNCLYDHNEALFGMYSNEYQEEILSHEKVTEFYKKLKQEIVTK